MMTRSKLVANSVDNLNLAQGLAGIKGTPIQAIVLI